MFLNIIHTPAFPKTPDDPQELLQFIESIDHILIDASVQDKNKSLKNILKYLTLLRIADFYTL
jgi:hypothetical protein